MCLCVEKTKYDGNWRDKFFREVYQLRFRNSYCMLELNFTVGFKIQSKF